MSEKRIDNLPPSEDELPEGYDAEPKPDADPGYDAVRVHHECPEQAVYFTVVLTAGQTVQNLLPRDPDRIRAEIIAIDNPVVIAESEAKAQSAANLATSQAASIGVPVASVTGPTIGQVITSAALPAGEYVVNWGVHLGGTTGNPEANNFGLTVAGVQVEQSLNNSTSGTLLNQLPVTVVIPAGGAVLAVTAIAAGTSTAVYSASFTATPVISGSFPAAPQGMILPAGIRLPVLHTKEAFVAATTTTTTRVSVLVQKR